MQLVSSDILSGDPNLKATGVELLMLIVPQVKKGELLFIMHAVTHGELEYAVNYIERETEII